MPTRYLNSKYQEEKWCNFKYSFFVFKFENIAPWLAPSCPAPSPLGCFGMFAWVVAGGLNLVWLYKKR